jgi:hypothetical protein
VFASENKKVKGTSEPNNLESTAKKEILVKIEEDECTKKRTSQYVGVFYYKHTETWMATRWSRKTKKIAYNGYYKDEITAAHASDTLARKLIANEEKGHMLNFPDNDIKVYPEKTSNYIGVIYIAKIEKWRAQRHSKTHMQKKVVYNGSYKDEVTAAHASDTLAKKLLKNGEKGHKLNFTDDDTEVYPEKNSIYIGVTYHKQNERWVAKRHNKTENKNENKTIHNGYYRDEITAAMRVTLWQEN